MSTKIDGSRQIQDETITGTQIDDGTVTLADMSGAAVVTEAEGLSSSDNDTSFGTTAAVIDYIDTNTYWAYNSGNTTLYNKDTQSISRIAPHWETGNVTRTLYVYGTYGSSPGIGNLYLVGTNSASYAGTTYIYGNSSGNTGTISMYGNVDASNAGTVNVYGAYKSSEATGYGYINMYGSYNSSLYGSIILVGNYSTSDDGVVTIYGAHSASDNSYIGTTTIAGNKSTTYGGDLKLYGNASTGSGAYQGDVDIIGSYRCNSGTSTVNIYGAQVAGPGTISMRGAYESAGSLTVWGSWSGTGDVYLYGSNSGGGEVYIRGSNTNTGVTYIYGAASGAGTTYIYGNYSGSNTGNIIMYGTYASSGAGTISLYGGYSGSSGTGYTGTTNIAGNYKGDGTINIYGTSSSTDSDGGEVHIYGNRGYYYGSTVQISGRYGTGANSEVTIANSETSPDTYLTVYDYGAILESETITVFIAPDGIVAAGGTEEITDITCPAGSTFTSSGAGDYWSLYGLDSSYTEQTYYVWYDVSSGNSDPAPGGTGIEVNITAAYTAEQVRDATATAIAAVSSVFNAIRHGNPDTKLRVVNVRVGPVTNAADVNAGVTVSVIQGGAYTGNGTLLIKGSISSTAATSNVTIGDTNNSNSTVSIYGTTTADDVDLRSGKVYKVNGTQVVTSQQSAIADASESHDLNATFSDTEVEGALDALGGKVNAILDALQAHGLIAT